MDIIIRSSLPKLREKLLEALQAVLPIAAIVLILCFSIAPVSPSILLCFLLGAAMIIVGIMFFTLGAEMSMTPMGERVGSMLTRSQNLFLIIGVGFLLGFLIGRGHTGGGDDEEYDDEPPRTPAKPLIPEERHTARVPRLVPREESSDSESAAIPDKTPADPVTPAAPAEEPATAERSAQDEPTQADEDEVRTMSLDDLLDDIHNM